MSPRLFLAVLASAAAEPKPCDEAVEGARQQVCEAYCDILACPSAPPDAALACDALRAEYVLRSGGTPPPCEVAP